MIDKLILLGTTHPRDLDLSAMTIPVMKICGSSDGVAALKDSDANKTKLPATTIFVVIAGGNHSQFGYGPQLGDHEAGITRESQQAQVLRNMLEFMKSP